MSEPEPISAQRTDKTDIELLQELTGDVCPCGKIKKRNQTFCHACFYELPPSLRDGLYKQLGKGYREAREAALEYLEALRKL